MYAIFEQLGVPHDWAQFGAAMFILGGAVLVALLAHRMAYTLARQLTAQSGGETCDILVAQSAGPARWILIAVALSFAQRGLDLGPRGHALWQQIAGFVVPGLAGWLAIALIRAASGIVFVRSDVSVADNLEARRRRTRVAVMTRIAVVAVAFVAICLMLLSIPAIRSIGVTLMASAGVAGLVIGAAAQSTLKNLIAGVQLAFTEPIRLDDVVIMDDEWGRIEEIRLTYVVMRIWDDRRLVVPVSKFLEESFQNWTRSSAELIGSVFLYVDPATDIPRLRAKADKIVHGNALWDRRFWKLSVTDVKQDSLEIRILTTARDASAAFDLRCDLREALTSFIATEMPEAIVRRRFDTDSGRGQYGRTSPRHRLMCEDAPA